MLTLSNIAYLSPPEICRLEVITVSSLNDSSGTYGKVLRAIFQLQDINIESQSTKSLTGTYTLRIYHQGMGWRVVVPALD